MWRVRANLTRELGKEIWAQREVPTCRNDGHSPHPAGSGWAGRTEHLEGKAGWLLQAAGLAVKTTDKGDPGGRLRGEVQVVINQLAPLHE